MNLKLLLTLGLVVGSAWMMRDTIATGGQLLTGRHEMLDNAQLATSTTTIPDDPNGLTRWERESNHRIRLWRDCTYTTYYEENQDECDRLHEGLNR